MSLIFMRQGGLLAGHSNPTFTERVVPFFHLWCLSSGLVEPGLKVRASMFPRLIDGGPHILSQDDKL
jgi:hypothetical protein